MKIAARLQSASDTCPAAKSSMGSGSVPEQSYSGHGAKTGNRTHNLLRHRLDLMRLRLCEYTHAPWSGSHGTLDAQVSSTCTTGGICRRSLASPSWPLVPKERWRRLQVSGNFQRLSAVFDTLLYERNPRAVDIPAEGRMPPTTRKLREAACFTKIASAGY